jgi:uncharacterized protein (TIGR03435 family)
MKKLMLWMIALAALCGNSLLAQSITGTWQGTLQAGRELRIVVKISTTDADTLKAVMYSIDQAGGAYEGRLNAAGTTMAGTWTQGSQMLPLTLARATAETAWSIPAPPAPPKPMAANADPAFEVATIKPSRPDERGLGFRIEGRRITTVGTSLSALVTFAYEIQGRQIIGAPAWLESDKWDVTGQPDAEGQPSEAQWKLMVQKLLADRFKLAFHRDKKELAVYALTAVKTGPKLTPSQGDPNGLPGLGFGGFGRFMARNANMADFARVMQTTALDRPIVDQTGISGRYDFILTWTPDEFQFPGMDRAGAPNPSANSTEAPDLFTAIQQELGLNLESTKAPAEVFVIDHVEKPSEN